MIVIVLRAICRSRAASNVDNLFKVFTFQTEFIQYISILLAPYSVTLRLQKPQLCFEDNKEISISTSWQFLTKATFHAMHEQSRNNIATFK